MRWLLKTPWLRQPLMRGALHTREPRKAKKRSGQEGYVLIGVLFLVFLVLVALSIAAPKMAASIERDREVELQHRAKQYVRAIKLYYKKFGAYPPTIEALEKQNEIRFLRKRYKDPITGKDDWKLIHFGQNKMPTAYGFFGQAVAGSSIAGIGPGAAGTTLNGASPFGNSGSGFGSGSLGSSGISSGTLGTTGTPSTVGVADSSGNPLTAGNTTGAPSSSSDGSSSGQSGTSSGFGQSSSGGSGLSNGQTFGGGGIIGVESTSAKQAILQYHKKTHFNEWEFVYDPMADQTTLSNNTNIGTPVGGVNSNGIATPGTFSGQQPNSGLPQQQQQQIPTPTPPQQQQQ